MVAARFWARSAVSSKLWNALLRNLVVRYIIFTAVCCAAYAAPVAAQAVSAPPASKSSVTLYGVVSVGLQYRSGSFKGDVGPGQGMTKVSNTVVMDRLARNRIGLRGVEPLGNGLSATFRLDGSFNPGTGTGSNPFWDATSTVGLASVDYGRLELGRQDNPALTVTLDTDPWVGESIAQTGGWTYSRLPNNAHAGPKGLGDPSSAFKTRNGVTYVSPDVGGVTVHMQYGFKETNQPDGQFGGAIKYRNGPLYLGVGFHRWRTDSWSMPVGFAYDFGPAKLYATYTKGKRHVYADQVGTDPNRWGYDPTTASLGSFRQTAFSVGVGVPIGSHLVRAAYVRSKDESPYFGGWDQKFSLGYTYRLSKRTGLIANFAQIKYDAEGRGTTRVVELGIRHTF